MEGSRSGRPQKLLPAKYRQVLTEHKAVDDPLEYLEDLETSIQAHAHSVPRLGADTQTVLRGIRRHATLSTDKDAAFYKF
jgi:hypothetical protein